MARNKGPAADQVTQILPNTRLRELIAPVVADFSDKSACRFGDQYMAVLVVTKYPARLPARHPHGVHGGDQGHHHRPGG